MGIYDRDYYRREGPSLLDSFAVRGQVVKWLLAVNIGLFVVQLMTRQHPPGAEHIPPELRNLFPMPWTSGPVTDALVLDTTKVLHGQVWRLVTYAFLHDPGVGTNRSSFWTHIVFNMWALWMFGGMVEDRLGRGEFLAFYLAAAVAGGLAFVIGAQAGLNSTHCLGASGAVMAVTILCACYYPTMTVSLFFFLPMPIWVMAILLVAIDGFGLLGGGTERVAFAAHLGGAAFAFVYYRLHWHLTGSLPSLRAWKLRGARPRLRVYHAGEDEDTPEPAHMTAPVASADVDEQLEAKLDAVLEKVARTGQASLTDSEKQILLRASEIYKKRRS
jgi:membrane associated rhomboid family serine protease